MYIVNTSFMVDYAVHDRWLDLMICRVIPQLRAEGFAEPVFTRVLSNDGGGHFTYSLQVDVADLAEYDRFVHDLLGEYAAIAGPLFGQQALTFTSLLKRVVWNADEN